MLKSIFFKFAKKLSSPLKHEVKFLTGVSSKNSCKNINTLVSLKSLVLNYVYLPFLGDQ